ncbi:MAG: hypothetical protein IT370_18525 [Deltaproteobacteria bacterium]|nr:hypothetical protein [Deltaproteobacteria bacterium]
MGTPAPPEQAPARGPDWLPEGRSAEPRAPGADQAGERIDPAIQRTSAWFGASAMWSGLVAPIFHRVVAPRGQAPAELPEPEAFKAEVYRFMDYGMWLYPVGLAMLERFFQSLDELPVDLRAALPLRAAFADARGQWEQDQPTFRDLSLLIDWVGGGGDPGKVTGRILNARFKLGPLGLKWLHDTAHHFYDPLRKLGPGGQAIIAALQGSGVDAAPQPQTAKAGAPASGTQEVRQDDDGPYLALRQRLFGIGTQGERPSSPPSLTEAALAESLAGLDAASKARLYDDALVGEVLLQSSLSPSAVKAITLQLDPVEQLYNACTGQDEEALGERSRFEVLRDHLQALPGEAHRAQRQRLLRHAPLVDDVINTLPADEHTQVIRLITTGSLQPDVAEQLLLAARAGDGAEVVRLTLAHGRHAAFQAGRFNLPLREALAPLSQLVEADGLKVVPYHLVLGAWGEQPASSNDPATDQLFAVVNPDPRADLPLNLAEEAELEGFIQRHADAIEEAVNQILDQEESDGWVDSAQNVARSVFTFVAPRAVEDAVNASFATDDELLDAVRAFSHEAASAHMVGLWRRAGRHLGKVLRGEVDRRLGGDALETRIARLFTPSAVAAVRGVFAMEVDAATVGSFGGRAARAGDGQRKAGQGAVPLHQALAEVQCGAGSLSQHVAEHAAKLFEELDEFSADRDDVEALWQAYREPADAALREVAGKIGDQRAPHAIELLANAYRGQGSELGRDLARQFDGEALSALQTSLGLDPASVAARAAGTDQERSAAAQYATARQDVDAVFAALAALHPASQPARIEAAGALLHSKLGGASFAAPAPGLASVRDDGRSAAARSGDGEVKSFAALYLRECGIEPQRHALEIARGLVRGGHPAGRDAITQALGVEPGALEAEVVADAADQAGPQLGPENRFLVAPGFTRETAIASAERLWTLLHGDGNSNLLTQELARHTAEEQRLIHVAFRQLSGGIDLLFYVRQAERGARQVQIDPATGLELERSPSHAGGLQQTPTWVAMNVGGRGTEAGRKLVDDEAVDVRGSAAARHELASVAELGKVDARGAIESALLMRRSEVKDHEASTNSLYQAVESASDAEARALLEDDGLLARLRETLAPHEWRRVSLALTGQLRLADMLASRCHGTSGSWFDQTDEDGMRADVRAYFQQRRVAIEKELGGRPRDPEAQDGFELVVNARLRAECSAMLANPVVANIIDDELSGTDRGGVEDAILKGGEGGIDGMLMTEGDWSEDEEQVLAALRAMPPGERARRARDPEFVRRVLAIMNTEDSVRDAMWLLTSQAAEGRADNLVALEQASRSSADAAGDIDFDEKEIFRRLLALRPDELELLRGDLRLCGQLLGAVDDDQVEAVRKLLSFAVPGASALGLGSAAAVKVDAAEQRRLGLTYGLVREKLVLAASIGEWEDVLRAGLEAYRADLRPRGARAVDPGRSGQPSDAGAASASPEAEETRLRGELALETGALLADSGLLPYQIQIVRQAIERITDPSAELLRQQLGTWNDDEEDIAAAIATASDEQLVGEWTSVRSLPAEGAASLRDMYEIWQAARARRDALQPSDPGAMWGEPPPGLAEAEAAVVQARAQFANHPIVESRSFERLLLPHAGTVTDDSDPRAPEGTLRADEYRRWRKLLLDRVPRLPAPLIAAAIGAEGDADAQTLIHNPVREELARAEERAYEHRKSRGERTNHDVADIVAGAEGTIADRRQDDHQRRVREAMTGTDPSDYNEYSGEEQADLQRTGEAADQALGGYREAKSAAGDVAAVVVGTIATVVVSALLPGVGTGLAAAFWSVAFGAVAGAAGAGAAALTREGVEGEDYDLTDNALRELALGVASGAALGFGQGFTAALKGRLAVGMTSREAARQVTRVIVSQAAATPATSGLAKLARELGEDYLEALLQGVLAGGATTVTDVDAWIAVFNQGLDALGPALERKIRELPASALRQSLQAALEGLGKRVLPKSRRHAQGDGDGDGAGPRGRSGAGGRAVDTGRAVVGQLPQALAGALAAIGVSEEAWRAEGWEELPARFVTEVLESLKSAGLEARLAHAATRSRLLAAARELHLNRHRLVGSEARLFMCQAASDDGPTTIDEFLARRREGLDEAAGDADGEAKARYERWVREAGDDAELARRRAQGPGAAPRPRGRPGFEILGPRQELVLLQQRASQDLAGLARLEGRVRAGFDRLGATGDHSARATRRHELGEASQVLRQARQQLVELRDRLSAAQARLEAARARAEGGAEVGGNDPASEAERAQRVIDDARAELEAIFARLAGVHAATRGDDADLAPAGAAPPPPSGRDTTPEPAR